MNRPSYPYRYVELHCPKEGAPLIIKYIEQRSEFVDSVILTEPVFVQELVPRWVRAWALDGTLPHDTPSAA